MPGSAINMRHPNHKVTTMELPRDESNGKPGILICGCSRDGSILCEDHDGTSGQDRDSYSDTQDRDSYIVDDDA